CVGIHAACRADFQETYNTTWLIERHGFRSPAAVRQDQLSPAALAA
ncbi:MAG: IS3 family transposase, partial [Parafilimonas terrae]|nr:IS3 family transposase [Parafilimonas terrae]